MVSSPDLLHLPLELLGPHCSCEGQQPLEVGVGVDVGVDVELDVGVGVGVGVGVDFGVDVGVGVGVDVGVGVGVGVGVVAAPSLQHQTLGGVSWWLCHSDRGLAVWCWAPRRPQALH